MTVPHAVQHALPRTRRSRRAVRDAVVVVLVIVVGGALFLTLDVVERLAPAVARWEAAQLDDLLLTLALAVIALAWFAFRRWQDSERRLETLRRVDQERLQYLKRLEELSSQLLDAEERERQRLAEALHDGVGQILYACQLQLGALDAGLQDAGARRLLHEAQQLVDSAMQHTRDLTVDLSPPILHDLGLSDAIVWLLPQLESRYGIRGRLDPSAVWAEVPHPWRAPVFHSVKELIINAGKHARATLVEVAAERDAGRNLRIRVVDNGTGFDVAAERANGFGLFSIERRMACIDGTLDLRRIESGGTEASLCLPCRG